MARTITLANSGIDLLPQAKAFAQKHGFGYVPCVTGDFGKVIPFTFDRARELLDPWGELCGLTRNRLGQFPWHTYTGDIIWDIEGSEALGYDLLGKIIAPYAVAGKGRNQTIALMKDIVSIGEVIAPLANHGTYGPTSRGLGSHYNANEHFDYSRSHSLIAGMNASELFKDAQYTVNCVALYLPVDQPLGKDYEFVQNQVAVALDAALVKAVGKIKTVLMLNPYVTAVVGKGRISYENLKASLVTAFKTTDSFGLGTHADTAIAWQATAQLVAYEGLPPQEWPDSRIEADQLELLGAMVEAREVAMAG